MAHIVPLQNVMASATLGSGKTIHSKDTWKTPTEGNLLVVYTGHESRGASPNTPKGLRCSS